MQVISGQTERLVRQHFGGQGVPFLRNVRLHGFEQSRQCLSAAELLRKLCEPVNRRLSYRRFWRLWRFDCHGRLIVTVALRRDFYCFCHLFLLALK